MCNNGFIDNFLSIAMMTDPSLLNSELELQQQEELYQQLLLQVIFFGFRRVSISSRLSLMLINSKGSFYKCAMCYLFSKR